ncbi:hypothetical protein [Methylobacterium sp. JK268]
MLALALLAAAAVNASLVLVAADRLTPRAGGVLPTASNENRLRATARAA